MVRAFFIALLVCSLTVWSSVCYADKPATIDVVGNEVVAQDSIINVIEMATSDDLTKEQYSDHVLKALYATQLFSDVKAHFEGTKLVVAVKENALISDVVFDGNFSIGSPKLEKEIQLKPRTILSPGKLREDIKRILNIYHSSGRFNTEVEAVLVKRPDGNTILLFKIDEGYKSLIDKIEFLGNTAFSTEMLRSVLFSQKSTLLNFMGRKARYDSDIVGYNEELLRNFYMNRGYPDFQVVSSVAELNDDRSGIMLTFFVEEGRQYHVGDVEVENAIPDFDHKGSLLELQTKKGNVFSRAVLTADIDAMTTKINELGYAFVTIAPEYTRNDGVINIKLVIKESSKVYINRVEITGNKRTIDKVIRRKLLLSDGDAFSVLKIKDSYRSLTNLNYFSAVGVDTVPTDSQDRVNLKVNVEDKKTGQVYASASLSTQDGLIGTIALEERNLLGTGQGLNVMLQKSKYTTSMQLGWYDPYFMDYNLLGGANIFYSSQSQRQYINYDSQLAGFSLNTSMPIMNYLSLGVRYAYHWNNVYDISDNASIYIKEQAGQYILSLIEYRLAYTKLDSVVAPTRGVYAVFKQGVTGMIGDSNFVRTEIDVHYMRPLLDKVLLRPWVFSLGFSSGYIAAYKQSDVRLNDRFYLGGDDFRGFQFRGLGPRDAHTSDSLGGQYISKLVVQLDFPLVFAHDLAINTLNLRGYTFIDAGTLFGIDNPDVNVLDSNQWRMSLGVGVAWVLPVVGLPVRLDLAFPVLRANFDRVKYANIRFSG